jgi:hypothetical protein
MEQRKRADLALGAYIRTELGWSLNLPADERAKIAKQAAALVKKPEGDLGDVILAAHESRKPFKEIENVALKNMEKLAKQLPVWSLYCENVRGLGAGSLAVIVAEAGDLSNYRTHSKLWKRMGLAVMSGIRQGGLPKGASADSWIEHGYNRQRRSKVWNIGDSLIKGNRDGYYRRIYLERKAYEIARDPDIKPIAAHRRAQRYMEKRLLKHLWQAWRRADTPVSEKTTRPLPDATIPRAA